MCHRKQRLIFGISGAGDTDRETLAGGQDRQRYKAGLLTRIRIDTLLLPSGGQAFRLSCRLKGGCSHDWPPHKVEKNYPRQKASGQTGSLREPAEERPDL